MPRRPLLLLPGGQPENSQRRGLVKHCALPRFGLDIGKLARQELIRRVRRGDVKYARKLTHSRTVIVLDVWEEEIAFLYSSATKEIVSVLPPDAPELAAWQQSQSIAPAVSLPAEAAGE